MFWEACQGKVLGVGGRRVAWYLRKGVCELTGVWQCDLMCLQVTMRDKQKGICIEMCVFLENGYLVCLDDIQL